MSRTANAKQGIFEEAFIERISTGTNGSPTLGNDVLFVPDFRAMLNELFINKVFTKEEKAYARQFATPSLRFASTFSVKEAVYKAVKQQYPKETLSFKSIEIKRDKPAGRPSCTLHHPTLNGLNISISISHDGDYVWAVALVR